ncbi:MAG: hypothetical protein AAF519_02180 [Bacteroidota bacterium]
MRIFLSLSFIIIYLGAFAQRDSLRSYYEAGVSAYRAKKYSLFLECFKKANEIRPNHPTITYNLASAYAINEKVEASFMVIQQLINMNTNQLEVIKKDSDFRSIVELQGFKDLEQYAEQKSSLISESRMDNSIRLDSIHIEGIAYNPAKNEYYLGAVNTRSLFSYSDTGLSAIINFRDIPNVFSILGVAYHALSNSIWLCTSALPQMSDYSETKSGYSSIIEYSLDQKRVITEILKRGASAFGDLTISKNGRVFVSDGLSNKIFEVQSGDTVLSTFVNLSSEAFNLQGLALSPNEECLFVADYISGIFKINTATKSKTKIALPKNVSPKGIDGLYFYRNSLLAIQNGTTPFRVMKLNLDAKKENVTDAEIFDQARPELGEPTQGVIRDDRFVYIANSPWSHYTENLILNAEQDLLLLSHPLKADH